MPDTTSCWSKRRQRSAACGTRSTSRRAAVRRTLAEGSSDVDGTHIRKIRVFTRPAGRRRPKASRACSTSRSNTPSGKHAVRAGAIVVATGWKPYDASRLAHLGYGFSPDVITNVEFEKMAPAGRIVRPSDGKPVEERAVHPVRRIARQGASALLLVRLLHGHAEADRLHPRAESGRAGLTSSTRTCARPGSTSASTARRRTTR